MPRAGACRGGRIVTRRGTAPLPRLPAFLLLGAALLAPGAARAAEETPGAAALLGQPVAALLGQPGVALGLRLAGGGWQHALAEAARLPGPPLRRAADGRHLFAWGCAPEAGCGARGLFLAWDPQGGRVFAALVENGQPVLFVPPRRSREWPAALAAPVQAFDAGVAGRLRFGR
ncbi:hypothetical protein [Caldovatus aquaticus]|uniref:Uncharacterized protein n=1 Tax=Caldovatus aquaticus TaxID=2865671 RepID=A0ABS7F2G1_9PROT|nr:hypothetical protein [Caldovatus aquaticus]MBW8269791.1 hypothetical protein [Caldovatus aquaticus]